MHVAQVVGKRIDTQNIKWLVVQGEQDIDEIQFKVLKNYDGQDISSSVFRIKYLSTRKTGDVEILSKTVTETEIILTWKPKNWATASSGEMWIQIYASLPDGRKWSTRRELIHVESSIDVEEAGEYTPQVLEQYLTLFEDKLSQANNAAAAADESAGLASGYAEEAMGYRDQASEILASKANRAVPARTGNLAALSPEGHLVDTEIKIGTATVDGVDYMTIEM